jgi:hypothetical protein
LELQIRHIFTATRKKSPGDHDTTFLGTNRDLDFKKPAGDHEFQSKIF